MTTPFPNRYHKKCYAAFVSERNINAAKNSLDQTSNDKEPFNHILKLLRCKEDKIWSSTELLEAYREKGGSETNSTRFINRIMTFMNNELYCFKSPGLATIVMHKKKASDVLKVVNNNEEDEQLEVDKIGKKIRAEIKELPSIKTEYPVLNEETLNNTVIPTLNNLLISISPKFQSNPLVPALISNIVTIIASSNVSMLQISLGLLVREKKMIECLHELGVTSSYDEVRRFKISAAKHATNEE